MWQRAVKWYSRVSHADTVVSVAQWIWASVSNRWVQAAAAVITVFGWSLLTGELGLYVFVAILVALAAVLTARAALAVAKTQETFGDQVEAIRVAAKAPPEVRTELVYKDPPDYKWLREIYHENASMGNSMIFPESWAIPPHPSFVLAKRLGELEPRVELTARYFNRSIFTLTASLVFGHLEISGLGKLTNVQCEGLASPASWFDLKLSALVTAESTRNALEAKLIPGGATKVDLQHLQVRMKVVDAPGVGEIQVRLTDSNPADAIVRTPRS